MANKLVKQVGKLNMNWILKYLRQFTLLGTKGVKLEETAVL